MRRRTWLFPALVLAVSGTAPQVAQAGSLRFDSANVVERGGGDGIVGPGDAVDATLNLTAVESWGGGTGGAGGNGALSSDDATFSFTRYLSAIPGANRNLSTSNSSTYQFAIPGTFACGADLPLKLGLTSAAGDPNQTLFPKVATGTAGARRDYASTDIGKAVTDGGTVTSTMKIEGQTGDRVKGLTVHIGDLSHTYGLGWYEISLVSPDGTKVKLASRHGSTSSSQAMHDLTFDDDAATYIGSATSYDGVTVQPEQALSAFDGETINGDWKLEVRDLYTGGEARSGVRGRAAMGRASAAEVVGELGDWGASIGRAVCSTAPDVWFGGADPVVLDGAVPKLTSKSVDPGPGGNTGSLTYGWKVDGVSAGTGAELTLAPSPARKVKVTLTATDAEGKTGTAERDVIITQKPMVDSLTANPAAPQANQETELTVAAHDADGTIEEISWDTDGDGVFDQATAPSAASATAAVKAKWATSGPKVVRVRITDDLGAVTIFAKTIVVANQPPIARLTSNANPAVIGDPVMFDASASTDPDGTVVRYEWDLDGDGSFEQSGTEPTVTSAFPQSGTVNVGLRVSDNTGQTAEVRFAQRVTARPVAEVTWSPTTPLPGQVVTFDASSSSDPDGSIVKYEWSLDGLGGYGATGPVAQRAYPNSGVVTVLLRLTDDAGAVTIKPISVMIGSTGGGPGAPGPQPPAPPAPAPTPQTGPKPAPPLTVPETFKNSPPAVPIAEIPGGGFGGDETPPEEGVAEDGFAIKLSASSKQKARKIWKKGFKVKLTGNGAAKGTVKVMITKKDAKRLRLKVRRTTTLGYGRVTLDEEGSVKVKIAFKKKYRKYVRRVKGKKSVKLTLRAVMQRADGDTKIAVGKRIKLVR